MNKEILNFQKVHMDGFRGNAVTFGNAKLPDTTAIFNMGPAFHCPADALGMCAVSSLCYAKKSERMYPVVFEKNECCEAFFDKADAQHVHDLIKLYWDSKKTKADKLRISEASDFKSQEAVNKMDEVAKMLKKDTGMDTYVYTARKDLDFTGVRNMIVVGSSEEIKGASRYFKAVPKEVFDSLPKGALKYHGTTPGCKTCNLCSNPKLPQGSVIYCKYH